MHIDIYCLLRHWPRPNTVPLHGRVLQTERSIDCNGRLYHDQLVFNAPRRLPVPHIEYYARAICLLGV
jgi:hypothetical protein